MVSWEVERYDWSALRASGSARGVPDAIRALQVAASEQEAERAYWRIDNTVVVQGALFEAALPTAACVVGVLPRCSEAARSWVLELLVQLGGGEPAPSEVQVGNVDLQKLCVRELARGVALYFDLLENDDDALRASCVDLLGICAREDASLRIRVCWYLERLISESINQGLRRLIEEWRKELMDADSSGE
jgi:hypothetical protein